MKECRVCKAPNNDSDLYCHVCGTKFPSNIQNSIYDESSELVVSEEVTKEIRPVKQFEYLVLNSLHNEIRLRHAVELDQSGPNYQVVFQQLATGFLSMLGRDGWQLVMDEQSAGHHLIFVREIN